MDLVDETFVVAHPEVVAAVVHDRDRWRAWWPDLDLTVFMDRATSGLRWTATGALVGSLELWLEPVRDGVVVHLYLRADPPQPVDRRRADRLRRRRALDWKVSVNALKDELEAGRRPGEPRVKDPVGPADTESRDPG